MKATERSRVPKANRDRSERLPLEGVRIVDVTWAWAGPFCSLQLAHLGAEVIRIESHDRPDMNRRSRPFADGEPGINRSGVFNQYNQGKRSLAVNLSQSAGVDLVCDLVAQSDIVVENFAPGVMDKLGLGYDKLSDLNPSLIMLSLSGYGATGPYKKRVAYGVALVMISGLASLTGYRDGPPSDVGIPYADPNAGLHGAFALLAALWHRRRTGRGQHIDLSMFESQVAVLAEAVMAKAMTGESPPRLGNRDPWMSPHGFFPCKGDDVWVALCSRDDHDWRNLSSVMERPDLALDPRFATLHSRKQHEDELETIVARWTGTLSPHEVARRLQASGVPGFPVYSAKDLVEDTHLNTRGYFTKLTHPEVGSRVHAGIPWQYTKTPLTVKRPAPVLGADTEYVVKEILGRSDGDLEYLVSHGVLY